MSRKSIKKIIALAGVTGLLSSLAISASAQTSSNVINGVTVSTTCNLHSSSHYIYKAYGSGSARIYYTQNGVVASKNVPGTSQSTYWVASGVIANNQNAYKATTTYSGQTVTAVYP